MAARVNGREYHSAIAPAELLQLAPTKKPLWPLLPFGRFSGAVPELRRCNRNIGSHELCRISSSASHAIDVFSPSIHSARRFAIWARRRPVKISSVISWPYWQHRRGRRGQDPTQHLRAHGHAISPATAFLSRERVAIGILGPANHRKTMRAAAYA